MERVTFSPGEFAALFGKSQTWGYRQIYAGKVTTITEYGRILIPAAEVERILGTACQYDGVKKKPVRSKAEFESMKSELQTAWQVFVLKKRKGAENVDQAVSSTPSTENRPDHRREALRRLVRRNEVPTRKSVT